MLWEQINEYILLEIFTYLVPDDIKKCACVCRWWNIVSQESILWKFKIKQLFNHEVKCLPPDISTWRFEYERISRSKMTKLKFTESIHDSGVTHAAFSGDGTILATCGNDSRVCLWKLDTESKTDYCDTPELLIEDDFSRFNWSRAVSVAFNKKKTSLLVSGVLKANIAGTRRGEIIILSVEEEDMGTIKSRIFTRPHETAGCWFNDNYVISSEYDWLTRAISVNKLWMNKVNFDDDSCSTLACMRQLYRLYNCASASIGNMTVVNVPRQNKYKYRKYLGSSDADSILSAQIYLGEHHCLHHIQIPIADNVPCLPEDTNLHDIRYIWDGYFITDYEDNPSEERDIERVDITYDDSYHEDRREDLENGVDDSSEWLWEDECSNDDNCEDEWEYFIQANEDTNDQEEEVVMDEEFKEQVLNEVDKLLLFTTGRKTYMPHQLGVKLMTRVKFKQHLDVDKSIAQFIREGNERRETERRRLEGIRDIREVHLPPYHDYTQVYPMFDIVDVIFDFQGFIVGYGVSRDSRYVYVHLKPWPRGYRIPDVLEPPPAGIQPQIVVIDLAQMKVVGGSDPVQRIFTAPENIISSPVQVTHEHVITTAGDYGLVVDRHHGEEVCRIEHTDILVCTGDPHSPSYLVTGGEDGILNIWKH